MSLITGSPVNIITMIIIIIISGLQMLMMQIRQEVFSCVPRHMPILTALEEDIIMEMIMIVGIMYIIIHMAQDLTIHI